VEDGSQTPSGLALAQVMKVGHQADQVAAAVTRGEVAPASGALS
jgi:hypothetical protein